MADVSDDAIKAPSYSEGFFFGDVRGHTVLDDSSCRQELNASPPSAYLCLVTHSTAIEIVYHFHYFALRRMMVMSSLDGTDGSENFSLLPGRA